MRMILMLLVLCTFACNNLNAQTLTRGDVIIDEIMADPSPQVGLPNAEWIELRNTSLLPINLAGWKIVKGTAYSGGLPNFTLQPDSMVVICSQASLASLSLFGTSLPVSSFPSLGNEGDLLSLVSAGNNTISAVEYASSWYTNELKKDGGWSLEMTDCKNACTGASNWAASTNSKGGTPGRLNSGDAINPDNTAPKLVHSFAEDSSNVILVFNEPLDSLGSATAANFLLSDGIGQPLTATTIPPLFNKVRLQLKRSLIAGKVYTVSVNALADCSGNAIGSFNTALTGTSSAAASNDVVINEIMFNPGAGGADYIEIYNRSTKILDGRQLYVASRNASGIVVSIQALSAESLLLFPGKFMLLTVDAPLIEQKYLSADATSLVQLASMPSLPDDKGDVILLNGQGAVVDEVQYSSKWQFELITNAEGVALERIDYNAPSVQSNFHSASTSSGYGTPGYKNSQYRTDLQLQGTLNLSPEIFSPDNDGTDDFATIGYNFPEPGNVINISIFNASGRLVRALERNALCGNKGAFIWDGLGEKHEKLAQGIYILFTETFNTDGKKKQFKSTIVLARRA